MSLMLVIAIISFLLVLLFKSITPVPRPCHSSRRHITFLGPSIVVTILPSGAVVSQRSPAKGTATSLSLTATPRELEPPTPDVAKDPLRAVIHICGFLTANTQIVNRGNSPASCGAFIGPTGIAAKLQTTYDHVCMNGSVMSCHGIANGMDDTTRAMPRKKGNENKRGERKHECHRH